MGRKLKPHRQPSTLLDFALEATGPGAVVKNICWKTFAKLQNMKPLQGLAHPADMILPQKTLGSSLTK